MFVKVCPHGADPAELELRDAPSQVRHVGRGAAMRQRMEDRRVAGLALAIGFANPALSSYTTCRDTTATGRGPANRPHPGARIWRRRYAVARRAPRPEAARAPAREPVEPAVQRARRRDRAKRVAVRHAVRDLAHDHFALLETRPRRADARLAAERARIPELKRP
jgi:hypothetical protein